MMMIMTVILGRRCMLIRDVATTQSTCRSHTAVFACESWQISHSLESSASRGRLMFLGKVHVQVDEARTWRRKTPSARTDSRKPRANRADFARISARSTRRRTWHPKLVGVGLSIWVLFTSRSAVAMDKMTNELHHHHRVIETLVDSINNDD